MPELIYEVTNTSALGTVPMANVMHFARGSEGAADLAELSQLALAIKTSFYDLVNYVFPAGVGWTAGAKVVVFPDTDPDARTFLPCTPAVGTPGAGAPLPGQLAVCINWLSALQDRSARGRTFVGPINVTSLDGPRLKQQAIDAVNVSANNLIEVVSGLPTDWRLGTWSRKEHTFARTLTGSTDGIIDVLRSRKY